ncbi:hypothetical protein CEQ31_026525 [Serratia odorifera]|nr:hypothetical protein CEQ31_026525 [Serratia odorifera]
MPSAENLPASRYRYSLQHAGRLVRCGGAALKPLADALRQDLLQQAVLQADETPLLLLNPEKGHSQKGYLWAYVSAAGADRAVVVYDCQPGRSGTYASRCWIAGRVRWSWTAMPLPGAVRRSRVKEAAAGRMCVGSSSTSTRRTAVRWQKSPWHYPRAVQLERRINSAGRTTTTMATTLCQPRLKAFEAGCN